MKFPLLMAELAVIDELAAQIPKSFGRALYHGTSYPLKKSSMYSGLKSHIFAAEDTNEAEQYGHVHRVHIRNGLKTAHLYSGSSNKDALNEVHKKFGKQHPNIIKTITSGKLWRNKPLEKKVHGHLFDSGYEHIIHTDEQGEDGGETTSHLIKNPQKNVYVSDH